MSEVKIPEGYKQTEIGVIPKDWDVFDFGNLINYIKGCPFKSADYQHTGVRIIRVSDTSFTDIKDCNPIYISDNKAKLYKPWKLKKDDLIISTVGSKPPMYDSLVGKVIKVTNKHDGSLLNQNALRVRSKSDTDGIQSLLLNNFRTERYIDFIERIYRGNANQASITLQSLFEFKIPLPNSKKEQTAIATALSDVDNLIQSLEKLIAKKEAIKTGTMQQLLTGKTRLPEFATREDGSLKGFKQTELGRIPEDWEVVRIIDNHIIATGNTPPTNDQRNYKGKFLFVSPADLGANKLIHNTQKKLSSTGFKLARKFPKGSTLFTCIGSTIGKTGLATCELTSNQQINAVFPNEIDDFEFTYYALTHHSKRIKNKASEQAVPLINKTEFGQFEYMQPNELKEQNAIASILSDMDAEIQSLQGRLEKTKDIKQGMMQQLLTGKVRLAH